MGSCLPDHLRSVLLVGTGLRLWRRKLVLMRRLRRVLIANLDLLVDDEAVSMLFAKDSVEAAFRLLKDRDRFTMRTVCGGQISYRKM